MEGKKYDAASQFRSVSWTSGGKNFTYYLGQEVSINKDSKGRSIWAHVYSISDSRYKVDGTSFFNDAIVINVMNSKGEVFKWWEIRNATNISLMHSNEQYLGL